MAEMKPTVNRQVHYFCGTVSKDGTLKPMAATIVDVHDLNGRTEVSLAILDPDARQTKWIDMVPFSETPKSEHWIWPARI